MTPPKQPLFMCCQRHTSLSGGVIVGSNFTLIQHSKVEGHEKRLWIDGAGVVANFEMKLWAGDVTCGSDITDYLARFDTVTSIDDKTFCMAVNGDIIVIVPDHHKIAVFP